MSRFFRGDSDSDEESEESSGEEVLQTHKTTRLNRAESSSDEDEAPVKRVVKSVKDKRSEELINAASSLRSELRDENWNAIPQGE
jgi:hypothetical protein